MNKTLIRFGSAVAALMLAAAPAVAQEYTFIFGHVLMENTPNGQAALSFAKEVETQSGGRIAVKVLPAGQLGGDVEIIEQIQQNLVQIAIPPTATLGNFEPRLQVLDLPYVLPSPEAMRTVLDGKAGRMILDTLEKHGMHGVSFWGAGFRQITNNVREVTGAADLKGVRMRTMQAPVILEQYRQWGASPVAMAFAEVYNGLQSGVIDGQENPIANIVSMNFYEVQRYMTLSNHAYHGYAVVVNADAWAKLPEDLKQVMRTAFDNARDLARKLTADYEAEKLAAIKANTKVSELTAAQRDAFVKASFGVHRAFEKEVTPELLRAIYEATGVTPE